MRKKVNQKFLKWKVYEKEIEQITKFPKRKRECPKKYKL